MRKVKCDKCGHIDDYNNFKHGYDFFQHPFISGCPKCDNRQSPGDASMRMFGGKRPFTFVEEKIQSNNPAITVLQNAGEAS